MRSLFLMALLLSSCLAQRPTRVKQGSYRLGFGLDGEIPTTAFRAKVGKEQVLLWDLDGDGRLAPHSDGMSLDGLPFIVRLPERLLVPTGQYAITFDETGKLRAARESLTVPKSLVQEAAELTRVRVRAGVSPIPLDEQLSKDCAAHCEYLRINGYRTGTSPHDEDPKKSGYTARGAEAGRRSVLAPSTDSMREAIQGWDASVWHSVPLVDPNATKFGVGGAARLQMLYPLRGQRPQKPFLHPADGATDVPRTFCVRGETPNPVPGTTYARGCGYPFFVYLPFAMRGNALKSVLVTGRRGKRVSGTHSCPENPANRDWPSNSGAAAFVPTAPLAAKTRHQVKFVFADGTTLEWSFTTGSR